MWRSFTSVSSRTLVHRGIRWLSSDGGAMKQPVAVFLNAGRVDYDGQLDWTRLRSLCSKIVLNDVDKVFDVDEMVRLVDEHQAEIVLTKEMEVPEAALARYPDSVKLLCEAGTGYNNLPIAAARVRDIAVCNIPTYSTEAVAHMAVTYVMNFSVSLLEQQRMLQNKDWSNFTGPFTLPLHELNNKTIGLVGGAGRIGTKVAEICLALGMNVIISSRAGELPIGHVLKNHVHVACTSDVDFLLQHADYVSLHTPLNDQTRGSFGRAQIAQMKPTAFLVNTSRGAVCNEDELIECMKERMIAGAGLDVTTTEPPAMDSELWNLDNVWLSPHTGWRRIETRQRSIDMIADNVEAYCNAASEADLINVVNEEDTFHRKELERARLAMQAK